MPIWMLLAASVAAAKDFDGLSCDQADLAKPMIGRKLGESPAVSLEKKYNALALKNLGGDMIDEEGLSSLGFWQLCKRNLVLVVDTKGVVADAVQFEVTGKDPTDDVCTTKEKRELVVVRKFDAKGAPAQAWLLDVKARKLLPTPLDGLVCPAQ